MTRGLEHSRQAQRTVHGRVTARIRSVAHAECHDFVEVVRHGRRMGSAAPSIAVRPRLGRWRRCPCREGMIWAPFDRLRAVVLPADWRLAVTIRGRSTEKGMVREARACCRPHHSVDLDAQLRTPTSLRRTRASQATIKANDNTAPAASGLDSRRWGPSLRPPGEVSAGSFGWTGAGPHASRPCRRRVAAGAPDASASSDGSELALGLVWDGVGTTHARVAWNIDVACATTTGRRREVQSSRCTLRRQHFPSVA